MTEATTKTLFQIKNRFLGTIIFERETATLKECVEEAVEEGVNLDGANLVRANLDGAKLDYYKNDLIASILKLPDEIPFLREAMINGKIDGTSYSGECACLAGTFAKALKIDEHSLNSGDELENGFVAMADSPRERWFWNIKEGHTPENSNVSKITLEWIDEALAMVEYIRQSHNNNKTV